ncbi:aldehyde dehydrogenase family protein [Actinotalea sp. BY-33]|uniref:Aldehyde dehydrogenase family protein n=1 Tax=Actinotalea soli TaxID=2819234 RepID=A0A939LR52_9CELL|nr:aldehyde dehydrogenase family protein [Actinotalea soli]
MNPRTGLVEEDLGAESTAEQVAATCRAAAEAAVLLAAADRGVRSALLRAAAEELEATRAEILAIADRETALGTTRLDGELNRTCYQLRHIADVVDDGALLEVAVDPAGPTPAGPRPELHRMLVPLGPVAVFGASNFPLAFSVPGGDTAAALAAGCPVVVKAHPAHPATSALTFGCLARAVARVGLPAGTVGMVQGHEAGQALVQDPHIQAVGFTGSLAGGRALFDLAASRPSPIPFYGELGSINPLVVAPGAAAVRAAEIAEGYVGSMTLGAGQFCTKPGLALVPREHAAEIREHLGRALGAAGPAWLLSEGIHRAFRTGVADRAAHPHLNPVRAAGGPAAPVAEPTGYLAEPALFWTTTDDLDEAAELVLEECFGPVAVVVEYSGTADLLAALARVPGSLTGTLHAEEEDAELAAVVLPALASNVGRVVYNGFPTGLAVAWGTTHTGPYPSSTSVTHSSVGASSVRRFQRPVTYQAVPEHLLPRALQAEGLRATPRRLDGESVPTGG